jgi:7-cyano-7-deazaguanine reductase
MQRDELLLGKRVDYESDYDPALLHPIARRDGRALLGLSEPLPFTGCDIWNGYELSWLDAYGKPVVALGEFRVPAESPAIIESKSLKLYLNSLNMRRFDAPQQVRDTIAADLTACTGAPVEVMLRLPSEWRHLPLGEPEGICLDELALNTDRYQPAPELLRTCSDTVVEKRYFSRLLRSRCPVTGQPDWGGVTIAFGGAEIDPLGLLGYIVSFRQHQDFHEQCVERMFCDIWQRCRPQWLTVSARYLRRGGLDINPWRSSLAGGAENLRWFQQ